MQHLDHLWKLVSAAASVRDMAQMTRTYQFAVLSAITCYLHVEHAEVRIARWQKPEIQAKVTLQAGFGWRVATDQDEAGVYLVAKRRSLVGSIARAQFVITLPTETHLVLKLEHSHLELCDLNHTLHIPPLSTTNTIRWQPE